MFRYARKLGLEGIVSKAEGFALPQWPIARLAQDEEPERARGATGKPRRIGAESGGDNAAITSRPSSEPHEIPSPLGVAAASGVWPWSGAPFTSTMFAPTLSITTAACGPYAKSRRIAGGYQHCEIRSSALY